MKADITQLLLIFDELLSVTKEEEGIYWFQKTRSDGLIIVFAFSVNENYVDLIIKNTSKVDIASFSLENCSEIRVLDEKRQCLEILHENGSGRCFLCLQGSPILDYKE